MQCTNFCDVPCEPQIARRCDSTIHKSKCAYAGVTTRHSLASVMHEVRLKDLMVPSTIKLAFYYKIYELSKLSDLRRSAEQNWKTHVKSLSCDVLVLPLVVPPETVPYRGMFQHVKGGGIIQTPVNFSKVAVTARLKIPGKVPASNEINGKTRIDFKWVRISLQVFI